MIKYISILPITLYLIYIVIKYGVQKSISESYYRLNNKEKFLFFSALVLTSLTFIFGYAMEHPKETLSNILIFLAGTCICFTGVAAEFKGTKLTEIVHYIGATVGYVLGYAFIVSVYKLDSLWFIIPSLAMIGALKWVYNSNPPIVDTFKNSEGIPIIVKITGLKDHFIWWAEIIGLVTIYLATIL